MLQGHHPQHPPFHGRCQLLPTAARKDIPDERNYPKTATARLAGDLVFAVGVAAALFKPEGIKVPRMCGFPSPDGPSSVPHQDIGALSP